MADELLALGAVVRGADAELLDEGGIVAEVVCVAKFVMPDGTVRLGLFASDLPVYEAAGMTLAMLDRFRAAMRGGDDDDDA